MAEKYIRRLRTWIPDEIKRGIESRYGPIVRSSDRSGYEEIMWVQSLYPVDVRRHLLLDIELSAYILD